MRRLPLASFLVVVAAASAADVALPFDLAPLAIPAPAVAVPQPRPRLSPEMVASITGIPARSAEPVATTPVLTDRTNSERAHGEIVSMSPYIVTQPRGKFPTETQVLTPKGRIEVAMKRRPGLKLFNLFGLNNGIALAMLEEDLALARRREMADLMSLYLIK